MRWGRFIIILIIGFLIFASGDGIKDNRTAENLNYKAKVGGKRLNIQFAPGASKAFKEAFFAKLGLKPIAFDVFGYDIGEWPERTYSRVDLKKFQYLILVLERLGFPASTIIDYQIEDKEKRPVLYGGCIHVRQNLYRRKLIIPWYDGLLGIDAAYKFLRGKNIAFFSQGIVIVDDGPVLTHPDIIPALKKDKHGNPIFWTKDKSNYKADNHGTHVACLAAADRDGQGMDGAAPPGTYILPLILSYDDGGQYFASDIAVGLKYYADSEREGKISFRAVNMSFGQFREHKVFRAAIKRLAGKLFVVAAGNETANLDEKKVLYPASWQFPNVLAVAATNHEDKLAYFSNYGVKTVGIAAPGAGIISCVANGNYENWQGTSMASPIVAGTAMLLFSVYPALTVDYAKHILFSGATIKDNLKDKVREGRRLNVLGAVQALWEMMEEIK